jgi:uncharacterized damage-inducible protein DinB
VTRSNLEDAFGHHAWATERIIEVCRSLTPHQLASPVPGTYGSILDMLRHIVGGDAWYLFVLTGGVVPQVDEDSMDLDELGVAMGRHASAWSGLLAQAGDPDMDVVTPLREDGTVSHAPLGIRLAQALHHGTDHRSQICTGLTALGVVPPEIDVWAYGWGDGRVFDTP